MPYPIPPPPPCPPPPRYRGGEVVWLRHGWQVGARPSHVLITEEESDRMDAAEQYYAPIRREHFADRVNRIAGALFRVAVIVGAGAGLAWLFGK